MLMGLLVFLMLVSLLGGCGKKKPRVDPEYDFPTGWWMNKGIPEVLEIKYTDDPSNTAKKCFRLKGATWEDGEYGENFGFVALTITDDIPIGKKVKVEVRIKTKGVKGNGPAITIRCDDTPYASGDAEQFTYSGFIGQKGTSDWKTYTLELEEEIQQGTQSVTIYLIFSPKTSGTIYYDLISYEFI